MPRAIVVRREPERGTDDHDAERALRSLRPWLQPGDEASNLHGFLSVAAARALPKTPAMTDSEIVHGYAWSSATAIAVIDQNGNDDKLWYRGKEYNGASLLLICRTHARAELKTSAEFVHRRNPKAAWWFMHTLGRLPWWVFGPREWDGAVQTSFWMGDGDEKYAIESGFEKPEDYDGPRRKDIDEALPSWAWDAVRKAARYRQGRCIKPVADPIENLRMAGELARFGIEMHGLLAADGSYLSDHPHLALRTPADVIDYPVRLLWQRHDWFEKALDEQLEMGWNSGTGTQAFAWMPAHNPAKCAEHYEAATGPLLTGLTRLCASLDEFETKHSPLLARRFGGKAKVKSNGKI